MNPIHEASEGYCSSRDEIEQVIAAGADIVMLPMFKTVEEVKTFIQYVNGRARTQLLMETAQAVEYADEILSIDGIDEIHIGLNDLSLAYHKKFMFELLCDGTVSNLCKKMKARGMKFGFGGIARIGYGMLPAEYIIAEHYHLGSTAAILSRGFCDANTVKDPLQVRNIFLEGVHNIRRKEIEVAQYSEEQYQENLSQIHKKVMQIVAKMI